MQQEDAGSSALKNRNTMVKYQENYFLKMDYLGKQIYNH